MEGGAQMPPIAEDNLGCSRHESPNDLDLNIDQDCCSLQDAGGVDTQQLSIQLTEEEEQLIRSLDVGTEFESDEHAHQFYLKYAKLVGFRIRKDWISRSKVHGQVLTRKFSCSNQGKRKKGTRECVKRIRKETRTGCLAYMLIQRQPNGKYRVVQFEAKHNHEYVGPVFKRKKKPRVAQNAEFDIGHSSDHVDSQRMLNNSDSQAVQKSAMNHPSLELEDFDLYEFEECNKSHLNSGRTREMKVGDAGRLLLYFQKQQFENPSFTYRIQLDSDDKITNIFWTDEIMAVNYDHFGDVVCFDTLYRTNVDFRPFVQFVGLNHHRQPVIFGAALLYDESVESLTWLLHSFVEAMGGKKPKELVSDQDAVIIEAANLALPETKLRVCIWQMVENALNNLRHMVHAAADSFASDFRRSVFDCRHEEDFVSSWDAMASKYDLGKNEWLRWMYREREKWSPLYGFNSFFVDLEGKHLVEGLSMGLKDYLKHEVDILEFFKHFRMMVREQQCKEQETNLELEKHIPKLMGNVFYLKHAGEFYTPKAFEMFQREYEKSLDVVVNLTSEEVSLCEYKANTFGQAQEYTVLFELSGDKVSCNCMMFQRVGVLCCHSMKVLDCKNIKAVPSCYILKRWSKDARTGNPKESLETVVDENPKVAAVKRYNDLRRHIVKSCAQASLSEEAYKYAEAKLYELLKGMEEILNPYRPKTVQLGSSSSNATNLCEAENLNLSVRGIQVENNCADCNDPLKSMEVETGHDHGDIDADAAMNLCLERRVDPGKDCNAQVRFQDTGPSRICSLRTDEITPSNQPHPIPPSENLFGYEADVPPLYHSPNLVVAQQNGNICTSSNFFPISPAQMLQEPFLQTAVMNNGQGREGMDLGISHPHPASLMHYDQRYRASADGQYFGMR